MSVSCDITGFAPRRAWSALPVSALCALFGTAAYAGDFCPAPETAELWQQAACELGGNPSDMPERLTRLAEEWGDLDPADLAIPAFWLLQEDDRITIFVWHDYRSDLPETLARQVAWQVPDALTPEEIDRLKQRNDLGAIGAETAAAGVVKLLAPMVERRGLKIMALDAHNYYNLGIAIVPPDYACRWDNVRLAEALTLQVWRGPDALFADYWNDPRWKDQPNECPGNIA